MKNSSVVDEGGELECCFCFLVIYIIQLVGHMDCMIALKICEGGTTAPAVVLVLKDMKHNWDFVESK